jgi:hypothetical protein
MNLRSMDFDFVMPCFLSEYPTTYSFVSNLKCVISYFLTFICIRRTLLRTTLSLSVLTDCDVMTRFVAPRYVNLEQRYVSTCVGAGSGGSGGKREFKAIR